jgi:predicted homoserine dehydrogenase-like protein
VKLVKPVAAGALVRWADVAWDARDETVAFRRQMEAEFRQAWGM